MNLFKLIPSFVFLKKYTLFLQAIIFLAFGFCIFTISKVTDQKHIISFSSEILHYNSQSGNEPINIINPKKSALLLDAKISFNFINSDPSFSYGNLFQTSSRPDGIRLELQPQNKLVLISGEGHLYPVAENLKSNQPYNIVFHYSRLNTIRVSVDGEVALNIQDPEITSLKFYIQKFVVGSGYSLSRPFSGEINNFHTNIQYSKPTLLATLSIWALFPITFIAFFLLYLKISHFKIPSPKDLFKNSFYLANKNEIYIYPLTFILSGLFIWITLLFGERHFGLAKWVPYLFIPFPLLIFGFKKIKHFKASFFNQLLILLPLILYILLLFGSIAKIHEFNYFLFLFFALSTSIAIVSLTQYRLLTALVSLISWLTIYPLLNWRLVAGFLEDSPFPYLIYACTILVLIGWFLYNSKETTATNRPIINFFLIVILLSIFFYLSFRTDTLFIPGSEYHWEYFVGPIRTIRNGGWLLYDAPSQYGFLNILLASLLPIKSSWQSFYIFQSSILFITSSAVLLLLFSFVKNSFTSKCLIFFLVLGSFFFADPAWIGPTPYPSSSVTRFFSCYLLLCLSFIPNQYPHRVLLISLGWLIGALWSAESFLYSTVIYFFYIAADLFYCNSFEGIKLTLIRYSIYPTTLLITTLLIITTYYKIELGHLPNFFFFFDYAIGYASGYGYVPFQLNGPGNIMLLIFLGLSFLTLVSIREPANGTMTGSLACTAGCVWAIGSYYLGRPVPQNITAMFPLLTTCVLIGLLHSKKVHSNKAHGPLSAAALPLLFLILSTFYISSFWEKSVTFESVHEDISKKLFHKSDELSKAIMQIDPDGIIPRVYLGDSAVSPILNTDLSEITWLPTPLQLVNPPITINRRTQILNRFLCSTPQSKVILIHQLGSVSSELPNINSLIINYFNLDSSINIGSYEVLLYSKNSKSTCIKLVD